MANRSTLELLAAEAGNNASLPRLLTAVGAVFKVCQLEEVFAKVREMQAETRALILSEDQFVTLSEGAAARGSNFQEALQSYRYLFIFPFAATPGGLEALGQVTKTRIAASTVSADASDYAVHGAREMCGAFSGLKFGPGKGTSDRPLTVDRGNSDADLIVTLGEAALLTRFRLGRLELFVNSCAEVFDVSVEYRRSLQAAKCFSSLVPLMFFLRHSEVPLPRVALRWANWIIDDPNLKSRYGFVSAQALAECVRRVGAAVTIGFIPWNHRRTATEVVNLFRTEWPRLSICVHGCDHTRSEFATASVADALQLAELARSRMHQMELKTSLSYEKVMVFPQGKFSRPAMCALRQSELIGAVNTELVDSRTGQGVKGGELLQPAITSYGGFPLFMRRPPEEPIANFALDLFFGKPCLIVTHHQYFQSGMEPLARTVAALNRLEPTLTWTNLERGITSTYTVRENSDHNTDIRLYSARTNLQLDPPCDNISFAKSEPMDIPDLRVLWDQNEVSARLQSGEITFAGRSPASQAFKLEVIFARPTKPSLPAQSAKVRLKIAARRYLSEFRDNYIDRSPGIKAGLSSARNLVSRRS